MISEVFQTTEIPGPAVLTEGERFLVKSAENPAEIRQAQRLRFRVFKEEQGRLDALTGDDCESDVFDATCAHILIVDRKDGSVVGTCRLRAGSCIRKKEGFYSAREYRFSGLEPYVEKTVELGRSCVAPEFRNGSAAALLWTGLAECRKRMAFNYMLGCASLEHNDFPLARALFRKMTEKGLVTEAPRAVVRRGFRLPPGETARDQDDRLLKTLPPLFKGYLRIGAKICGAPAFDREFGSIDFPVWFDFINLPDKYCRHFKVP